MDTEANKAYKLLPLSCPALWTNQGISGCGADMGIRDLYDETKGDLKCLVFSGLSFRFTTPMFEKDI